MDPGMAKSIVRVVDFGKPDDCIFLFTCPWTTLFPAVEHCLRLKMLFQHISSTYQEIITAIFTHGNSDT